MTIEIFCYVFVSTIVLLCILPMLVASIKPEKLLNVCQKISNVGMYIGLIEIVLFMFANGIKLIL